MTRRAFRIWIVIGLPVVLSTLAVMRSCGGGHMLPIFAASKSEARYRTSGGMALPDPDATPGAVDKEIEADPSGASFVVDGIEKNICAPHFSATAIRKTIKNFPGLKKKACAEYGIEKCDGSVEGDHLISIELGGCPDCLTNLWPQPMDEARIKDHQVEDVLPKLICSERMTLREAQKCVSGDWVECADRLKTLDEVPEGRSGGSKARNRASKGAQYSPREGRGGGIHRLMSAGRVPQGWKREFPASWEPVLPPIGGSFSGFPRLEGVSGGSFGVVLVSEGGLD